MMKLTEPWGELNNDSKGEDDGLKKKKQGRGGEGKNTPARSHCSFDEPVHWIDGTLIGAVGCLLIAVLPIKATFFCYYSLQKKN